jgi:hypothetical protein
VAELRGRQMLLSYWTIVKLKGWVEVDRPAVSVALSLSLYLPGGSFLVCETRPLKRIRLAPWWAGRVSVPASIVRVQRGLWWLRLWLAHLPWTLWPDIFRVKLSVTLAGSLSVNENVVPIGRLRMLAVLGSLPPSRQTEADWRRAVIDGFVAFLIEADLTV